MRKGCIIGMIGTVAAVVLASLYGLFRIATTFWDFPSASGELPAALAEYQANGLPFVASEVAPTHRKSDQDAAPGIRAALKALPKKPQDSALAAAFKKSEPVPDAVLVPFSTSLATIETVSNRPNVDFHRDWDLGPNILFPEYAGMKSLTRAAAARAVRHAAQGDDAAALKDLALARQLALWADQEPTLTSMLVRIASETIALNGFERCLVQAANDPKRIARYQSWLADQPPLPDFGRALRGEAFLGVTICRNFDLYGGLKGISGMEDGKGTAIDPSRIRRSGLPPTTNARAFLARHLQVWNEAYRTTDRFRQSPEEIGRRLDGIAARLEESNGLSNTLERILLPVFGQAGQAVTTLQARRAVQGGFAEALLSHSRTGSWPRAVSPIDPFTGKPLKVKMSGTDFRVYSVGKDHKDDGGLTRREAQARRTKTEDVVAVYPLVKR